MSKAKKSPSPTKPASPKQTNQPDTGKRRMLFIGLGGLGLAAAGGLAYQFSQEVPSPANATNAPGAQPATAAFKPLPPVTLTADQPNAIRAAEDVVSHYSRELLTPWALIHAVRGLGKDFKLWDGKSAVDYLCTEFTEEREANGKRYLAFQRNAEVHENSFLKTFLEAGVSPEQVIRTKQNQYTLRQLGEHAQALFRCDPNDWSKYEAKYLENHLPWGLIAFSWLNKPQAAKWTNAYGEQIDLPLIFDRALASYENTCDGLREGLANGEDEPLSFRQAITKHSCYGLHAVYGFFACYRQGYRGKDISQRIAALLDTSIHRLAGDAKALDREADAVKAMGPDYVNRMAVSSEGRVVTQGAPPPNVIEVMRLRQQIQMHGHILEAVNYGLLNKLFTLTPDQQSRVKAGEQALYEHLVKLRATDLDAFRRWHSKFVSDVVIAVGHAARALKLLTPKNPDLPQAAA